MWLRSGAGGEGCCVHNRGIVVKCIVIASLIVKTVDVPRENQNYVNFHNS